MILLSFFDTFRKEQDRKNSRRGEGRKKRQEVGKECDVKKGNGLNQKRKKKERKKKEEEEERRGKQEIELMTVMMITEQEHGYGEEMNKKGRRKR